MKKITALLLALVLSLVCCIAVVSCDDDNSGNGNGGNGDNSGNGGNGGISSVVSIYDLVKNVNATKIVTGATVTATNGDDLSASVITERNGNDSITSYAYRRYATPAESLANNNFDRIVEENVTIYCKDGLYSTDGISWKVEVPTTLDVKFDLREEYLTNPNVSEDGNELTATLSAENAKNVFGTDMSASGDITLKVVSNGIMLYTVELTYTTTSGSSVYIKTTYTNQPITLEFPSAE